MEKELRVIVSGGGTGGHIFPAISIANAIKAKHPEAKILFIGALGRMEMQRVPQAGYEIKGLPVKGLVRPIYSLKNIVVGIDFLRSKFMAKRIVRKFKPDVAVGVGGYASAAALDAAHALGVPCLIQEQNSYAGKTNKMLASGAKKICVAYNGMERFFPADKIIMTGNPVRQNVVNDSISKEEARKKFGLDPDKKTILLVTPPASWCWTRRSPRRTRRPSIPARAARWAAPCTAACSWARALTAWWTSARARRSS